MKRHVAFHGVMFALLACAACDDPSPAPFSPSPLSPNTPAAIAPPPAPIPGSYPLAGVYTLELNLGSGCAVVPEAERIRRYTATIDYASGGRYVVTLGGATFLTGPICTAHAEAIGCDQFFASEDIDTASFFLENNNDDAHGGHIVERLSSGAWVELIGGASGKFGRSSIEATGSSSVWYCPTPRGYPFPCFDFVACTSTDMTLKFTRQ